jgi:hypothetical protein
MEKIIAVIFEVNREPYAQILDEMDIWRNHKEFYLERPHNLLSYYKIKDCTGANQYSLRGRSIRIVDEN